MTIAMKIKNRREELGMTQVELAEKSKLTQPCISQIEKGKYTPAVNTVLVLAKALLMSTDELLGANDERRVS